MVTFLLLRSLDVRLDIITHFRSLLFYNQRQWKWQAARAKWMYACSGPSLIHRRPTVVRKGSRMATAIPNWATKWLAVSLSGFGQLTDVSETQPLVGYGLESFYDYIFRLPQLCNIVFPRAHCQVRRRGNSISIMSLNHDKQHL